MHRNIDNKKSNSRLIKCLKICVESLDWIRDNSSVHNVNRVRIKDTLEEIKNILEK